MRLYLIAGEVSGDRLGAALMAGLRDLMPDVEFHGVGGAEMAAQGLVSQFPMEELSVMGIAEIAPKYFQLKRRIREAADAVLTLKPDALITIDSPDFCLRVAKRVKAHSSIKTIHYVAPTVWAWRAGRAEKMARVVDHVLALFPFEPPYMRAAGMSCDFTGHPVVNEPVATKAEADTFRANHAIDPHAPLLLVLPGSRRGEVMRLAPVFGETVARLKAMHPDLQVILPAAGPVVDLVNDMTSDWPLKPIVLTPATTTPDEKRAGFAAANVALAASGTVSLELAAARTPMVIAYDMNWLSRKIIRLMLKTDTVTLVNLVAEMRVVPEFLAANCTAEKIAPAVLDVLAHPDRQATAMTLTMERLGRGQENPGLRAARSVLNALR